MLSRGLPAATTVVVTEVFEVTEVIDGAAVERRRARLTGAAALRPARLVVGLRRSPRIDAAAIAVLVQRHREMIRTDGRLTMRGPVARVCRLLRPARVDHVLEVEEAR
ncbi:STAS domain-containing protein [Actinoplanes sp. N902-109]|uniref:STAS domain-containing protein n=1 Tax=Actinoplanes sp. (strain N902-109) TaxID=649831 RepID=UPI0003295688|nr:STAS domain-containing protein [Actinoplanes sp. N902-109]AGL17822.1 putative anti-sigma factor [Actinoplanes sp. N902-109]